MIVSNGTNGGSPKIGRIAVIAGALGYVGKAIAERLAKDGMRVAALYRSSSDEEVQAMIAGLPGTGHAAYRCDLALAGDIQKTIDLIAKDMGPLFACVYAAGNMPKPKQLHALTEAELREEFDTAFFTCFNFLSACARELKRNKDGVLIGITTAGVATPVNTKARGAYGVAKFAEQGMLVALKEELAASNVRVYSIAPGVMPGGLNKGTPKAFLDMVREKAPAKRLAEASDVAAAASTLCSEGARAVSDLTFVVAPETTEL